MNELNNKRFAVLLNAAISNRVPENTAYDLCDYIIHKRELGGFLEHVVSNDLFQAFARADLHNRQRLWEIVCFLYSNAPIDCHGSKQAYANWIKKENVA